MLDRFTPEIVAAAYATLPSGARNSLGQYDSFKGWADRFNHELSRGNLPDGFAVMNANDQVVNLLNRILQRGDYLGEPHSPPSTYQRPSADQIAKMTDSQKIQSLIEESGATRADASHFLNRQTNAG